MTRYIFVFTFFIVAAISEAQKSSLMMVESPGASGILAAYYGFDNGGNTSVAFDLEDAYKWSGESPFKKDGWGYFTPGGKEIPYIKRDRDIGQTFSIEGDKSLRIKSITVRLGFGSNVVRPGMYGQKLSIQLFEVTGRPEINNNGTSGSTEACHGFPHDRSKMEIPAERDDYITGETFRQVALYNDFVFPEAEEFGSSHNSPLHPDDQRLKGRYLKFTLSNGLKLFPGKQYAFMILINEKGKDHGFTLANNYSGDYPGGHAIRRDGNGTFPPATCNPIKHFSDKENREALNSAHFPENFRRRIRIQPSTNGYPDVDTWRDLYFIIEGE